MKKKLLWVAGVLLLVMGFNFVVAFPAQATPSGTTTISVNNFTGRALTPAFSVTATYSNIALNEDMNSIRITLNQLGLPGTCTSTATVTWLDCGISGMTLGGSAASASTTVEKFGLNNNKLVLRFPSPMGAGASYPKTFTLVVNFAASSLRASSVVGASSVATDFGDAGSSAAYTVTTPTTYTVAFNANGGSGTMSSQSTNSDTALTPNAFTRAGYTFGGWATSQANATAGTVAYADGANYDFLADTTLYAIWTANSNGGSGGGSGPTSTDLASTGFATLPYLGMGSALVLLGGIIVMFTKPRRVRNRSRI